MNHPVIVWFKNDLRLSDHPALFAAAKTGAPVLPLYIFSEEEGAASRVYLHYALKAFQKECPSLIIRKGEPEAILRSLVQETAAQSVYCGLHGKEYSGFKVFNTNLLFEPGTVLNKEGKPYTVFTPFYKCLLQEGCDFQLLPAPNYQPYNGKVASLSIDELNLLPKIHWEKKFVPHWLPCGEEAAIAKANQFLNGGVGKYSTSRDFPALSDGVSHLSTSLHFGEMSPRTLWNMALEYPSSEPFLRQLVWREFAHHLLHFFPKTVAEPLKPSFAKFPWRDDPAGLKAWQKGMTGYPFVDAGMRELWQTGWMHNRVRMVVASFLVKDLLLPWQEGARWFWDTLVDADLANNTFGWQWCAGCGADAAPYFRIFNPTLQGEKFDPEGEYVKRYVPELKELPKEWIHRPFEAPELLLRAAGVILGKTYPYPIVDHAKAKERALVALKSI